MLAATGAYISALGLGIPVLARKGALGALFASDLVLLGAQLLLPLGVRLLNLKSLIVLIAHRTDLSQHQATEQIRRGSTRMSANRLGDYNVCTHE